MTTDLRFLAIGAHLRIEDASHVEGVDLWPVDPLQLSVLAFDGRKGVADRELIGRAAATRRELLNRETFIAIRYGFTVRTREEAAARCQPLVAGWEQQLKRFRGSVEVTLKAGSGDQSRPVAAEAPGGREYLLALHRQRTSIALPDEFRMAVEARLGGIATVWKWQSRDDGAYEFCAVVSRELLGQVTGIGASLKQSFAEVPFLLSGPWPLEAFASE